MIDTPEKLERYLSGLRGVKSLEANYYLKIPMITYSFKLSFWRRLKCRWSDRYKQKQLDYLNREVSSKLPKGFEYELKLKK